jgi:hypothetical protein
MSSPCIRVTLVMHLIRLSSNIHQEVSDEQKEQDGIVTVPTPTFTFGLGGQNPSDAEIQ